MAVAIQFSKDFGGSGSGMLYDMAWFLPEDSGIRRMCAAFEVLVSI